MEVDLELDQLGLCQTHLDTHLLGELDAKSTVVLMGLVSEGSGLPTLAHLAQEPISVKASRFLGRIFLEVSPPCVIAMKETYCKRDDVALQKRSWPSSSTI
ncbi:hypothetical protein GOP47_0023884 [Adiantum capillus-veneris]|uniref:Uncharacterized protein n=1 Tax=Adiantum capillus-veneris TaxID=13818 RepID=A0A9D4U6H8_ADICA|nr:hypothetical protein GOP47_0023884 [Adiantum capillus-veneris]